MDAIHPQSIVLRTLQEADIPACHRLREMVGWNQTESDWRRFRAYNPDGCFVMVHQDKVAGTACTISYENKFGWVAMVIVDPQFRRMGIGTQLLQAGIQHLENRGLTVKLDATPEGKMLYDTLGFRDEYGAARLECKQPRSEAGQLFCSALTLPELDELDEYDRDLFGASRKPVLHSYLLHYPESAYFIREKNAIAGYILAREGTHAFHIGPWAANDPETARRLLACLLGIRKPDRVFIDILEPNPHVRSLLESIGFQQQRPFIRMYKGRNFHPGKPELIYGMSGPELG